MLFIEMLLIVLMLWFKAVCSHHGKLTEANDPPSYANSE